MKQIKDKEYFSRYHDGDYQDDVLLIGINYEPKTNAHLKTRLKFEALLYAIPYRNSNSISGL